MKYGKCPICEQVGKLTTHHVLPKRYFNGEGRKIKICWICHTQLELDIPQNEEMPIDFYEDILTKYGV